MRKTCGTALALLLFGAAGARADFSYTTTITPTSQTFGTGSTVQFGPVTSVAGLQGTQFVNLANVADLTTTSPSSTDSGTVGYTITMNITQVPGVTPDPAGTGALTVNGSLTFFRSDTGGELSQNAVTGGTLSTTIAGVSYNLSGFTYAPPTVNAPLSGTGQGNISGLLTVRAAVPEPSSAALVGLGGFGLLAVSRRRRARAVA
jgi:hypothetical protein